DAVRPDMPEPARRDVPYRISQNRRTSASEQATAQRDLAVWLDQHYSAMVVRHPERQHLRLDGSNLTRRKIHDGQHQPTEELVARIQGLQLSRRSLSAQLRAEINRQLPRRLAGLRKILDVDDATDTDVNFVELVESNRHERIIRPAAARQRRSRTAAPSPLSSPKSRARMTSTPAASSSRSAL